MSRLGDPVNCSFTEPAIINNEGKVAESTNHVDNVIISKSQLEQYKVKFDNHDDQHLSA